MAQPKSDFVPPRRLYLKLHTLVLRCKSWWFDAVHGVTTRANKIDKLGAWKDHSRGFWYLPTSPQIIRTVLERLPVEDLSNYVFVDFGSGKGRVLLLASTLPFRCVWGVELDEQLHKQAQENLGRHRRANVVCKQVLSFNMDVLEFELPVENIVCYFFNPFGETIMQRLISRLEPSLAKHPRDIILIFVYPEYAFLAGRSPYFRLYDERNFASNIEARNQ